MIEYLKNFAKTIVPDLNTTPEIIIKEMMKRSVLPYLMKKDWRKLTYIMKIVPLKEMYIYTIYP